MDLMLQVWGACMMTMVSRWATKAVSLPGALARSSVSPTPLTSRFPWIRRSLVRRGESLMLGRVDLLTLSDSSPAHCPPLHGEADQRAPSCSRYGLYCSLCPCHLFNLCYCKKPSSICKWNGDSLLQDCKAWLLVVRSHRGGRRRLARRCLWQQHADCPRFCFLHQPAAYLHRSLWCQRLHLARSPR